MGNQKQEKTSFGSKQAELGHISNIAIEYNLVKKTFVITIYSLHEESYPSTDYKKKEKLLIWYVYFLSIFKSDFHNTTGAKYVIDMNYNINVILV